MSAELKPGNNTTKAMIAFGSIGGIFSVLALLSTRQPGVINPSDPTGALSDSVFTVSSGAALMSFGITSILGGVRRTLPHSKESDYELVLFSNSQRNNLKAGGEIAVGLGLMTAGVPFLYPLSFQYRNLLAVPVVLTVAGIAAVAVAEDSAGIVKWS
jgi:hypothetical protein